MTSRLAQISQQIITYMGMSTVITGVIGNLFNITIFLSLKTFRQNSCAFYLIVMSVSNIVQLLTGQLSRVVISGFGKDWTQTSLAYCKCRWYLINVCSFISFTCLCLAIIDQFLATSARVHWQQWSNIKIAKRASMISIILWVIYGTPYLIYYGHSRSATTGATICSATSASFRLYHAYMNNIVLYGGLPICITVLFGSLAYRNITHIAYRTVPLVRRELDKQLTNMVLIEIIFSFFFVLPYIISGVIALIPNAIGQSGSAQLSFALNVTACFYYLHFSVS